MKSNRISALLRYDYTIFKNKARLFLGLVFIIFVCTALIAYTSLNILDVNASNGVAVMLGSTIYSFFGYAAMAMVFFVTSMLHFKFTDPRHSTSYLSLPGTSAEKFIVMMLEYLIGAVVIFILYVLCFYLTMSVCWIAHPELNWFANPLQYFFPSPDYINNVSMVFQQQSLSDVQSQINGMASEDAANSLSCFMDNVFEMSKYSFLSNIVMLLLYVYVNLFFRTNGQLKTVGIFFVGYVLFMIALMVTCLVAFGGLAISAQQMNDAQAMQLVFGTMTDVFIIIKWALYLSPIACVFLGWLIYKKISKKEAK